MPAVIPSVHPALSSFQGSVRHLDDARSALVQWRGNPTQASHMASIELGDAARQMQAGRDALLRNPAYSTHPLLESLGSDIRRISALQGAVLGLQTQVATATAVARLRELSTGASVAPDLRGVELLVGNVDQGISTAAADAVAAIELLQQGA